MSTIAMSRKLMSRGAARRIAIVAASIAVTSAASTGADAGESLIYSFSGGNDGANPYAGLTVDGSGNVYGATLAGGSAGQGVVFEIPSGGTFTVLAPLPGNASGSDGAAPTAAPILSGGTLYGTASRDNVSSGGSSGNGVVYELSPSGAATPTLFSTTSEEALPMEPTPFPG